MVAAPVSRDHLPRQATETTIKSTNFSKKSKQPDKQKLNPKQDTSKLDNNDLAKLSILNEQTVLEQLKLRYSHNKIYVNQHSYSI